VASRCEISGVRNTLASACEARFLGGDKADSGNGEGGQPFLANDPNASALRPMIPAMQHGFFSTLTIAVVAGVTLLVVLCGLWQVLLLIASYGD
jgi:hypothetical protein